MTGSLGLTTTDPHLIDKGLRFAGGESGESNQLKLKFNNERGNNVPSNANLQSELNAAFNNYMPEWAANTAYDEDTRVYRHDRIYRAITNVADTVTAVPESDTTHWKLVGSVQMWKSGDDYDVDQIVLDKNGSTVNGLFVCTTAKTNSTERPSADTDNTNWTQIGGGGSVSTATRASLNLDTDDSPTFAGLTITGNIDVQGTTTSTDVKRLDVGNKEIVLNNDITSVAPTETNSSAHVAIKRGTGDTAVLRFKSAATNANSSWQLGWRNAANDEDVSNSFYDILTADSTIAESKIPNSIARTTAVSGTSLVSTIGALSGTSRLAIEELRSSTGSDNQFLRVGSGGNIVAENVTIPDAYTLPAVLGTLESLAGSSSNNQLVAFTGTSFKAVDAPTLSIGNGAIGTTQLANNAVTNVKIVDRTIDPIKIAQDSATDGQVLAWDNTNTQWSPADAPSTLPSFTSSADGGKILSVKGSGDTAEWVNAPKEIDEWKASVAYNVGNVIIHDNSFYQCRVAHTSQTDTPPVADDPDGTRTNWTLLVDIPESSSTIIRDRLHSTRVTLTAADDAVVVGSSVIIRNTDIENNDELEFIQYSGNANIKVGSVIIQGSTWRNFSGTVRLGDNLSILTNRVASFINAYGDVCYISRTTTGSVLYASNNPNTGSAQPLEIIHRKGVVSGGAGGSSSDESTIPAWTSGSSYVVGNQVRVGTGSDTQYFVCIADISNSTESPEDDTDNTNWQEIGAGSSNQSSGGSGYSGAERILPATGNAAFVRIDTSSRAPVTTGVTFTESDVLSVYYAQSLTGERYGPFLVSGSLMYALDSISGAGSETSSSRYRADAVYGGVGDIEFYRHTNGELWIESANTNELFIRIEKNVGAEASVVLPLTGSNAFASINTGASSHAAVSTGVTYRKERNYLIYYAQSQTGTRYGPGIQLSGIFLDTLMKLRSGHQVADAALGAGRLYKMDTDELGDFNFYVDASNVIWVQSAMQDTIYLRIEER